ncbi:MAG: hypothetical protein M1818_004195 [Claussenomyces sp. TS43310]|nr:MAG: hypothetical protein M1818_004195 [Claussenomyces sp. TS43310]
MAATNHIFLRLWMNEEFRADLLAQIDDEMLCSLRLTSPECYALATPRLFERTRLTFTPSSLSRPSRLEALSRIGHHIKHLTFSMPHTPSTFLPPLLNPLSGREVTFLYTPHTSLTSELHRPKYGTQELGEILTDQYPPIFHAATNVPAFIRFLSHLPNLRQFSVSTPDQEPSQRYRRSAVDYALISLRIALEHASLPRLCKLTLSVHPSALLYLKSTPSVGSSPRSTKFWSQIRKLKITLDSWDFYGERPGHDHLRLLDTYVRSFALSLERVSFRWNGARGPCPLTLPSDPLLAPPRKTAKLFAEITSPMSPLPAAPPRSAMLLPKLRFLRIRNVLMSATQVSDLVYAHRKSVREFDFENVDLTDGGDWEDALSPLTKAIDGRDAGGDRWRSQQSFNDSGYESNQSLRSMPSNLEHDQDAWPRLGEHDIFDTAIPKVNVEAPDSEKPIVMTTKLKRRRVKHRRRRHDDDDDDAAAFESNEVSTARYLFGAVHNDPTYHLPPAASTTRPLFGAISDLASRVPTLWPTVPAQGDSLLSSHALNSKPKIATPEPPTFDGSQDPSALQPRQSQSPSLPPLFHPASASPLTPVPPPMTLQPRVFNPNIILPPRHRDVASETPDLHPLPLNVKRNHALDAKLVELSEDAERRQSALKKAREVVLAKLGSQFSSGGSHGLSGSCGGTAITSFGLRSLMKRNGLGKGSGGESAADQGHEPSSVAGRPHELRVSNVVPMGKGKARLDSVTQLVPLIIFR